MRDTNLLQLALGLTPPWTVTRSDFDPDAKRLDIQIDFSAGQPLACRELCAPRGLPAYDTERMTGATSTSSAPGLSLNARVPRLAATSAASGRRTCLGKTRQRLHLLFGHCS